MSDLHPMVQLGLAFGALIGVGGLLCAVNDALGCLLNLIGSRR